MGNEYRAKVFKSGNSVALRLPKALGLGDGDDVIVAAHDDGSFSFWRSEDGAAILLSLYGSVSEGFMAEGRGDVDQSARDWASGDDAAAA
ncbi:MULTISPECIES: antitoxin [Sphingomonas]|jgi:antitoxin VapB|uniref:AbrB family transcriptional regulator n=1 Tax=Sphingomonas adhaesiva TaxID=28212 RepID=A0A2A4IDP5_9SPHN|nr:MULTISPECIES: AbrB/MazE/SpoVT family DNA-binding domain-containing protein [Sphingomonas]PCG15943.1 AbrB family transcriptional regulator [Sphingomonas adhaesiva]PZU76388.1 MAG: AbrB family transcriptional regulator [Sphingomonas sp.]